MSLIIAQNLIRRLRSSGIRVYLDPAGCVAFRGLSDAPAAVKKAVIEHGRSLRAQLHVEAKLRQTRQAMNGSKHQNTP